MENSGDTIFGKIIRKEVPATIVYETENVLAFRDISPVAPTHIVIIPKRFVKDLASTTPADKELLGELMLVATEVAKREGSPRRGIG